jgi:YidC/Oxa1 family membrane protein insertase
MDKNSVIGLILIAAILIGFSIWNSPSKEQIEEARRIQDSIATAKQLEEKAAQDAQEIVVIPEATIPEEQSDSVAMAERAKQFGAFANAAAGETIYFTLENELLKLKISSKGGRIVSAELKNYHTYDTLPLILFEEETSNFGFNLNAGNRVVSTQDLFFDPINTPPVLIQGEDSASFTLRLNAGNDKFIDYTYSLQGNSYLISFNVVMQGINELVSAQNLSLYWDMHAPSQEKSIKNQRLNTTIYYGTPEGDHDYLSETKDVKETIEESVRWIGLKQQFFSSVIISERAFEANGTTIETVTDNESTDYVKHLAASMALPFGKNRVESYDFKFFFGPNHYQTLRRTGYDLHKIVPLGWGIFGWVNRFLVIPVFNALSGFNLNFGIVILILTIIIKLLLSPFTYKAYLSTAKMRVLKPEIDELNKKHEKDDPLKKQQAVMALYKKAGVNPLGGCIPMVLQLPILIAMFRFFPASIELRQERFLWAEDLSTYDSIFNLPFTIPFYGDHVSLFTLLMTVSTIIYTRMNSQLSASPEMAQMKWMMYLMPIVFLGVFNDYAAGLSYYYFLTNIITFAQQLAMRKMVDEKALLARIEENKKKPEKKSAFQKRLEDAAKKRGFNMPNK